jgi:tetratricopeptide (TPR) repeat protein
VAARNRKADVVNPAAYNLYLKARELGAEAFPYPTVWTETVALLEQVVEADPSFADAWARLAQARGKLGSSDPDRPYSKMRAGVLEAAETALRLDPGSGLAYFALAELEPFGDYDKRKALVDMALAVAPDDGVALTHAAVFTAQIGRIRDAQELADRAFGLDPRQIWSAYAVATLRDYAGDTSSLPIWETCCDLWPDSEMIFAATWSAALHSDWDRFDALSARARQVPGAARQKRLRGMRWLARNMRAREEPSVAPLLQNCREELARTGGLSIEVVSLLYGFGLTEESFRLIEEASFAYMFDRRMPWGGGPANPALIFSIVHNALMMADPRFPVLCAKMGLCRYWVSTNRWPDCADVLGYDFRGECRRLAA